MSCWSDILNEVNLNAGDINLVKNKYLKKLADYTGRNVITYYSGWLRGLPSVNNYDINDDDMNGFMNCVYGLDCSKGLDLILHTPGGSPTASESIVNYLRTKFKMDIRVIVPHMAMSAGTMIACSAKSIIMGNESSLGPIDPQFNGIPAYNIVEEFLEAKKDLSKNPNNAQYWAIKLQQYPAAFMKTAIDAISLSSDLLEMWLRTCMFENNKKHIKKVLKALNEHNKSKSHGRHYNYDYCKEIGLKVELLEDDNTLQDLVLSVHHCYVIALQRINFIKIIDNHIGKSWANIINI